MLDQFVIVCNVKFEIFNQYNATLRTMVKGSVGCSCSDNTNRPCSNAYWGMDKWNGLSNAYYACTGRKKLRSGWPRKVPTSRCVFQCKCNRRDFSRTSSLLNLLASLVNRHFETLTLPSASWEGFFFYLYFCSTTFHRADWTTKMKPFL